MTSIAYNAAANRAVNYLNTNSLMQSDALSKLASGSSIIRASDNAAGLAVATNIGSDIDILQQALTNATGASSMVQTADSAGAQIGQMLVRMKVLASQSASGTASTQSRGFAQSEFLNLQQEIEGISETKFNGTSLISGDPTNPFVSGVSVMVGTAATDVITIKLASLDPTSLGVAIPVTTGATPVAGLDISTQTGATSALSALDSAIDTVSAMRAQAGAVESRLDFRGTSIKAEIQNLQDARSGITDVDVAAEQAVASSASVLVQSAVSAEVTANQSMSALLKLFA
jgi:flagellin